MTPKEAIKAIKCNYPPERYSMLREALNMAIEALEKQEKYKWHDLRKNPKDLPDERNVVIGFDGSEYGATVFYDSGIYRGWATSDQDFEPSDITAWRYMEPFEEDNK